MTEKYRPERLLSYVVASDNGLAPNITGNICTLSVCKPVVRKSAIIGRDIIVGVSTNPHGPDRIIYAMQVDEKLSYHDYFNDPRFSCKKPDTDRKGDNFFCMEDEQYKIAFNSAAHHGNPYKIGCDIKSPFAVIGHRFWYFGENAPRLPKSLRNTSIAVPGKNGRRGHRVNTDPNIIKSFTEWINKIPPGIHGKPRDLKP